MNFPDEFEHARVRGKASGFPGKEHGPDLLFAPSAINTFGATTYAAGIDSTILRWQCFVIVLLTAVALVTLADITSRRKHS